MVNRHIKYLKSNFLFFLLTFAVTSGFAQYLKIPIDSNYYWKQTSSNTNTSVCSYHYQIKYKKDTIINSKTYNKYSTFGATAGNNASPCNVDFVKHGYLRQDTLAKKVFILDNNFIERPLYNFSKMIGDTMLMYRRDLNANITVTVTMRDSTQFSDGIYHKWQFAISSNPNYGNYFLEGVGSMPAGLYGHTVTGYIPNSESLQCFGKISPFSVLYGNSNCYLSYVGLRDDNFTTDLIKIYPNPVIDKLNIESENSNEIQFSILNSLGQIVYSSKNFNSKQEIDLSFLSNGVYYLRLSCNTKQQVIKINKL